MNFSLFRQQIKPWMLPIAIVAGLAFHNIMDKIAFLSPYLIFVMLLITFCKVKPNEFRLTRFSWYLLLVQVAGALFVWLVILPFSKDVAQATFICIFCPTATAAPVITGMLGGSISRLASYSIISNVTVALLAPLIFAMMGADAAVEMAFTKSVMIICQQVVPLIVLPLIVAFIMLYCMPKVHGAIATHQSLSFYIWAIALFIVVGRAVNFIIMEPIEKIPEMIIIALFSMAACCLQFYIGRKIGQRCGDRISGAQGLGQKNTVLAIWMALTYLNPITSIGPAAYVVWQNTINSLQLYYKAKRGGYCKHRILMIML